MSKVEVRLPIVERVFKDMYKLEIPPEIKVHPTFHVSLLKPFKVVTLWPDHKRVIRPPPDLVVGHLEYGVEGTLKCRKPKWKTKGVQGEMARVQCERSRMGSGKRHGEDQGIGGAL